MTARLDKPSEKVRAYARITAEAIRKNGLYRGNDPYYTAYSALNKDGKACLICSPAAFQKSTSDTYHEVAEWLGCEGHIVTYFDTVPEATILHNLDAIAAGKAGEIIAVTLELGNDNWEDE